MERIITQEKMYLLQKEQTLLRKKHHRLMNYLVSSNQLGPMEKIMVIKEIKNIRREMMENRTGSDGLRSLNTQLRCTRQP